MFVLFDTFVSNAFIPFLDEKLDLQFTLFLNVCHVSYWGGELTDEVLF